MVLSQLEYPGDSGLLESYTTLTCKWLPTYQEGLDSVRLSVTVYRLTQRYTQKTKNEVLGICPEYIIYTMMCQSNTKKHNKGLLCLTDTSLYILYTC